MAEIPMLLHIYGQDACHAPVRIIGTVGGLVALARALAHALMDGEATTGGCVAADGEGYAVSITCCTADEMDTEALPYPAAYAQYEPPPLEEESADDEPPTPSPLIPGAQS